MSPLLLGLATLMVAILIYRLFKLATRRSHPLPPGPRPWPIIGNLPHLGPVPHHALAKLAQIYGSLMHLRLGFVDVVVAASASVAAQFLKVHDANFSSRPPNAGANTSLIIIRTLYLLPTAQGGECSGKLTLFICSPARPWMISDISDRLINTLLSIFI